MLIAEGMALFQDLAHAVVKVNVAQLAIDTVNQYRKSTDLVVFDDDGEGLTDVAAAPLYALSKTRKATSRIS